MNDSFFPEVLVSCLFLFFFLLGKYTFFIVYFFLYVALAPFLCVCFLRLRGEPFSPTNWTVLWEEKLNEGRFVGLGADDGEDDKEGVWGVFVNSSLPPCCLPHRAKHACEMKRCKRAAVCTAISCLPSLPFSCLWRAAVLCLGLFDTFAAVLPHPNKKIKKGPSKR